MNKIEIKDLNDNLIESIGKEWMLITSGTSEKFNTMTASWGGTGFLWNKPVAFIFVRPERYTYEFIEQNDLLTLSFLGEKHKAIHKVCGSKSGRDTDKIKETGLKPFVMDSGAIGFEQSRLTLECRKLYFEDLKADHFLDTAIPAVWYGVKGGWHRMYVIEILSIWKK